MQWHVSLQLTHVQSPFIALEAILRVRYMNAIKSSLYSSSLSIHNAFGITLHPAVTSRIWGLTLFFILFALLHIIICYVAILVKCRHHYNLWTFRQTAATIIRPICMRAVRLALLFLGFKMQIGSHKALRVT